MTSVFSTSTLKIKCSERLTNLSTRKIISRMYKCFACGGELVWEADFMRSELDGCSEEEDTVVNILRCSNCGAEVRVYHNNQTEEGK